MEGEVALGRLSDRYPRIELDERAPGRAWRFSLTVQ